MVTVSVSRYVFFVSFLLSLVGFGWCRRPDGHYNQKELIPVDVNTVYPYNNPSETYSFYEKIPFCKPLQDTVDKSVGSPFQGDIAHVSPYRIHFLVPISEPKVLCTKTLSQNDIKVFLDAIKKDYIFTLFVDSLLVTAFVGEKEVVHTDFQDHHHDSTIYYLFTHWNFHIEYNLNHIISIRLTTDISQRKELTFGDDIPVEFTYTVEWHATEVEYGVRAFYHQRNLIRLATMDVHWLSILNSTLLVIVLTAFLSFIFFRAVKRDCARYESADELEDVDDPGWKQVHRDVFRPPPYPLLFSAAVGTGTQLLVLVVGVLVLSLIGTFYPGNRGALATACIFVYCFTAGVAGHVSGKLYIQLGGTKWATNAVVTSCVFAVPFMFVFSVVNTIASIYGSTMALPISYIFSILLLWAFVTFPLTIFGAHRVRNLAPKLDVPGETNIAEREIPELPWYRSQVLQIFAAGVLPFTSIYIELHYIFTAVFGHRVYTLFGVLSLAFGLLLIVTAAVTIALTYFQLVVEDYRWWWRSFFTAGSTGAYILGYAAFYYKYRSYMTGALQTAFFFGYITVVSYGFFLLLGAVGWWSTFIFVKQIYSVIKGD